MGSLETILQLFDTFIEASQAMMAERLKYIQNSSTILFETSVPCCLQGIQKLPIGSFTCPPPRKSLVKGERFLRYEGRPELDY